MVLTADEYDALPPNNLRELVDGVVRVMATPTFWHQDVADALKNALRGAGEHGYRVSGPIEVRLGNLLRRNPDVVVVRREHYDRRASRVLPEHVVLAVEVVSPGSETDDRREKPVEYAEAGMEHYWRVEIDPEIAIHTFRLGDNGYLETGVWKAGDVVDAPGVRWARILVDDIIDA
ncbi:Uma2 family endonuclease [Jiangella alkaliphila]|uniref:Uma2 family endonuclease n=1 Tax=Jiangella alkaliphila TaxID=419479 RepID=UPI001364CF6E|nr:Uma2 family endonuclease [Jiangella alkaliphila]